MSIDEANAIRMILERLDERLKNIEDDIRGITNCRVEDEQRIRNLEIGQKERQTQISTLQEHDTKQDNAIKSIDERLDDIAQKTGWWNGANTLAVIIAGAIAFIKGN